MTLPEPTDELTRLSRENAGMALGLIGVIIFGGTLPATRVALGSFSPAFVTFGRAAVAALAAAVLLALLRKPFPRADVGALLLAGALLVFGFPILSSLAMQTVPASHGGVVLGVMPLATSLFAALFAGERPSPPFWACGIAGSALVVVFAMRDGGMRLSGGDAYLLAAGVSASLGYVVCGRLSRRMPGWEVICWALVVTAPVSLAATALCWQPVFLDAPARHAAAFFYLCFGSMFLGFFAWNVGLAMGGIARVSQVQLLQSFVTLAISATLLGETITGETIIFAFAVMIVVAAGRSARVTSGPT